MINYEFLTVDSGSVFAWQRWNFSLRASNDNMALPVHSLTQRIGFWIPPVIDLQRDMLDPMEFAPLVVATWASWIARTSRPGATDSLVLLIASGASLHMLDVQYGTESTAWN